MLKKIIIICLLLCSCQSKVKKDFYFDEILTLESIYQIPDSMGISGLFSDFYMDKDSLYFFIDILARNQIFKVNTKNRTTTRFGHLGNGPNEYHGAASIHVFNDTVVINDDLARYIYFNQEGEIIDELKVNNHIAQSQFIKIKDEYIGLKTAPVQYYLYSTKRGHFIERQASFQFPSSVSGLDLVHIGQTIYFTNAAELKIYNYDLKLDSLSSFEIKGMSGQNNWASTYDKKVSRKLSSKMLKKGYWNNGFWKLKHNDENLFALNTAYQIEKAYIIIFDIEGHIKAKFPSFVTDKRTSYRRNIVHIQNESIISFETDSIGEHYLAKYRLSKSAF